MEAHPSGQRRRQPCGRSRWFSPKYEIHPILGPAQPSAGEYLATEEGFRERAEMNTKQCHQSENKMLCIKGNLLTTTIQEYNLLHLLVIFRSLAMCIYLMECSLKELIFVIWQEQGTKGPLNKLLLVRWGGNKLPVLQRMFLPEKLVSLMRFTVIVPNLKKEMSKHGARCSKLTLLDSIRNQLPNSFGKYKNSKHFLSFNIYSLCTRQYQLFSGAAAHSAFSCPVWKLWDFYDKSLIKAIKQFCVSLNTKSQSLSLFSPHHAQSLSSSCLFWPFCCQTANNRVK